MQVGQGVIDDFTISSHDFRSTLSVGLLDRLLDVLNRFVTRQYPADAKKAGLHDRVDAAAHSDLFGQRVSVDGKETDLFCDDLFLRSEEHTSELQSHSFI